MRLILFLMGDKNVKILVVAQTPPPHYGQSLMVKRLVEGNFKKIDIFFIRMHFSSSIEEIGVFKIKKIFHLIFLIVKTIFYRYKYGISALYYIPGGGHLNIRDNMIPFIRDMIFLGIVRLFFKKTIFHFRSVGLDEIFEALPHFFRKIALRAYKKPHLSIHNTPYTIKTGNYIQSEENIVIPNGIEDISDISVPDNKSNIPVILYVGIIAEQKGSLTLLKAADILVKRDVKFTITFIGDFFSKAIKEEFLTYIKSNGLEEFIELPGAKYDEEKFYSYKNADIFCFPSYRESFGNSAIEAMMFSLPVVGTKCGGLEAIVKDGETGYLVPVNNPVQLADKLEELLKNPAFSNQLGKNGRSEFMQKYLLSKHLESMENALYRAAHFHKGLFAILLFF